MKTEKSYVKIDSRNRVTLPKSVTKELANLYSVYTEGRTIILEPVMDVPEEERWIFDPKNKEIVDKIKRALKQKANIRINLDDYDPSSSSADPLRPPATQKRQRGKSDSVARASADKSPKASSGSRK
jgi:hypothetical protein